MNVKTHEVLRLWRLPEVGAPQVGPAAAAGAASLDTFELVLDPSSAPAQPAAATSAAPRVSRPRLPSAPTSHEVAPGETIQSIIAQLQAAGLAAPVSELERRARFHHPGVDLTRLRAGTVLDFGPVTALRAPTQAELVRSPIVRDAVEDAWRDSKADDPQLRHEEGGWIYMNIETGVVFTHRAPAGSLAGVDLRYPVAYVDAVVVGTFHTHPNGAEANYDLGPSESDRNWDYSRGVPGIVRSSLGYHTYGWERRRLDLEGPWAFPGTPENDLSGDPGPARSRS